MENLEGARNEEKIFVANEQSQIALKQEVLFSMIRDQEMKLDAGAKPTVIPDHIMKTLQPIFIIRHPVFRIPSLYISFARTTAIRPGDEDWVALSNLRSQRLIFDYFKNHTDKVPIVVDGDDVVWRTEELGKALGHALDLDSADFSETWSAVPDEESSKWPIIRIFLETIDASTGVERGSAGRPEVDVEVACQKWAEMYGADVAKALKGTVEESLPHYEYMKQFAI